MRSERDFCQENRKGRLFEWFGGRTFSRERQRLLAGAPFTPRLGRFPPGQCWHLTEKAASMPSHESRLARQPDAASDGHARREHHIRIRSKSKGAEMPLRAISTRTSCYGKQSEKTPFASSSLRSAREQAPESRRAGLTSPTDPAIRPARGAGWGWWWCIGRTRLCPETKRAARRRRPAWLRESR